MINNFEAKDIAVFFGKTGVGKTSTINTLFDLNWATDNTKACTSELAFEIHKPKNKSDILIVDIPGIAESELADEKFFQEYIKAVSNAGHIIWIFQGDTRVYRPDQIAILKLKEYFGSDLKFTVCLNQVDLIGKSDWNKTNNTPSPGQLKYIEEKKRDILDKFNKYIPNLTIGNMIAHSVKYKYNTTKLYNLIINR